MDSRTRRLYFVCVGTSIVLVVGGWFLSLRSAMSADLTQLKADAAEGFEKVGERLNQLGGGARAYSDDFSQSLETAKEAYEESKIQP
jgi:hypothetical protein